MMRVYFDIASNYFHNSLDGFLNDPPQARLYFEDTTFKFHAATTYNSSTRRFEEFTDYEKLYYSLLKADELITFNGRICDLIVLEKLVGREAMRSVWRKTHYDLAGWGPWDLKGACFQFLPKLSTSFDSVCKRRLAMVRKQYKDEFIATHLANTYRDVKFTYAIFRKYISSGNSDRTFRNIIS